MMTQPTPVPRDDSDVLPFSKENAPTLYQAMIQGKEIYTELASNPSDRTSIFAVDKGNIVKIESKNLPASLIADLANDVVFGDGDVVYIRKDDLENDLEKEDFETLCGFIGQSHNALTMLEIKKHAEKALLSELPPSYFIKGGSKEAFFSKGEWNPRAWEMVDKQFNKYNYSKGNRFFDKRSLTLINPNEISSEEQEPPILKSDQQETIQGIQHQTQESGENPSAAQGMENTSSFHPDFNGVVTMLYDPEGNNGVGEYRVRNANISMALQRRDVNLVFAENPEGADMELADRMEYHQRLSHLMKNRGSFSMTMENGKLISIVPTSNVLETREESKTVLASPREEKGKAIDTKGQSASSSPSTPVVVTVQSPGQAQTTMEPVLSSASLPTSQQQSTDPPLRPHAPPQTVGVTGLPKSSRISRGLVALKNAYHKGKDKLMRRGGDSRSGHA